MIRPIIDTLRHLGGGQFLDQASEELAAVVQAVTETGKAGSVTIRINVRKATADAMAIRGEVDSKKPEASPFEMLMFPTPEGNLLRENPNQQKLDLKEVPPQRTDLKEAVQ